MGNAESSPPEAAGNSVDDFDGIETLGYRVLGVQPNSPASAAGLVSFFDFLIGADSQMLLGSGEDLEEGEEYDDVDFPALLEKFKGKTLQLLVWNIKCQEQRLVDIIPSDEWEGAGLLGVTIRLDNYAGAEDRLIRILSVEHNSPAAIAGLVASQDYLLGTTTHSFDSTKVLAAVLEAHVDKVVELYVYNIDSDKVRVVALMPTWSWGGNGLLGAEVGTGYLHRIPGSCRSTLGGSVERRVRWIGGKGPTTPQQQQSAALELEPQLEMEHDEDYDKERHSMEREESMRSVSMDSHQELPNDQAQAVGGYVEHGRDESAINSTNGSPVSKPEHPISESTIQGNRRPQSSGRPSADSGRKDAPSTPAPTPAAFPTDEAKEASTPRPVSAQDLFSGPPPAATPHAESDKQGGFSTPHPPSEVRQERQDSRPPPTPPVNQSYTAEPAASYAVLDMPPPPKMSGAI